MEKLEFIAPVKPVGKARPRMTKRGHTYTPENTKNAENNFAMLLRQAMAMNGLQRVEVEPVCVSLEFWMKVPTSYSKGKRERCLSGEITPCKKPDIDNQAKLVLDACNGIAFKDDAQVIELHLRKKYSAIDAVKVEIRMIEPARWG